MEITNYLKLTKFLAFVLFAGAGAVFAQVALAGNVSGEAWAGNIGWIRFKGNATNGAPYGVDIHQNTGVMSGYAWSNNIGSISFNSGDFGVCPQAPCPPKVEPIPVAGKFKITGWARACSVFISGCTGALKPDSERGGWDGWIKLNGLTQNNIEYGWYIDTNGYFHGYAYGASDSGDANAGIIGWISANCLEGSNSGTTVCHKSDYKLHTTVSFVPQAVMSCNAAFVGANCPDGICNNAPGEKWRVYIPATCATCQFGTITNDSIGEIAHTKWEIVGESFGGDEGNLKTNYTFQSMPIVAARDYTLKLTVTNSAGLSSSAERVVNIRRDIAAVPKCTFDAPYLDPLTKLIPNPAVLWKDCASADFKSRVVEGEKIYLKDESSGSDSGAGPTVIVSRLWTLAGRDGTQTSTGVAAEFFAGRNNTITLRVNDSNTPSRSCTATTGLFNGMSLPEWQEVGPVGMILRQLTARISDFFAAL